MTVQPPPGDLINSLSRLLDAARTASLTLDTPRAEAARIMQRDVCEQLSDYILPRLVQLEAPLLVVVGGSTGAGKSTLVNSLVGDVVSESSVLRPTTRAPVLVHHPDDAAWFAADRLLPNLRRSQTPVDADHAIRLAGSTSLPAGIALLDAPDFDSVDTTNRTVARQLLAAADMWLLVTSAARYADEVPWSFLKKAVDRNTAVAVVLDRTEEGSIEEVRSHLARMMTSRGLADSPLFTVPESDLDEGLLPGRAVQPILDWFGALASDESAQRLVVGQSLDGAIRHNVYRVHDVADAMDDQADASAALTAAVTAAHRMALTAVERATRDGSLLTGPVLARWQEYVHSAEILRNLEDPLSRLRHTMAKALRPGRTDADAVAAELAQSVAALLVEAAEASADAAVRGWTRALGGSDLLDGQPDLARASRDVGARVDKTVREWLDHVKELVRIESASQPSQILDLGSDGDAVALMVAMLDGARTTGDASVAVKLLNALFGERTVALVRAAHADLIERAATLLVDEENRFLGRFVGSDDVWTQQSMLREAAQRAEAARHINILERLTG